MGNRKRLRRRSRSKGGPRKHLSDGASTAPSEPTLFDLPLQTSSDDPPDDVGTESAPATGQGPSILFDEAEPQSAADLPTKARQKPKIRRPDSQGKEPQTKEPQSKEPEKADSGLESQQKSPQQVVLPGTAGVEDVPLAARGSSDASPTKVTHDRPQEIESSEDKAFLGDRLLGGLADLAAQLIALGLAVAATHSLGVVVTFDDWGPFAVLALVFSFLYWTMPLAFWGQTPGMAWVGHLARSPGGEPLSFGQTFMRWAGSVLTLALVGLPMLAALSGRSLSDRISGSHTIAPQ